MPTYQYVCDACGEFMEAVQSFSDDPLTQCPACKQEALRKNYGSVGVVFKGSGFYRTDSRGSSSSTSSSGSTPSGSPASGSTSAGSTPAS